ncbi:MAG: DedA family protein [Thermoleophilaceae bacterium]
MSSWVSRSPFTYLIVLAFPAIDAVIPLLPGESVIVSAAVLSSSGQLIFPLVVAAGFAGAVIGDCTMFLLGSKAGRPLADKIFRSEKARGRLDWAEHQLEEHGGRLVVAARFLPGGRTATTFGAGMLEMRWRKFLAADALGSALWAGLFATIGYMGGQAFQDSPWKGIALSLAIALGIGLSTEAVRRLRRRVKGRGESSGSG